MNKDMLEISANMFGKYRAIHFLDTIRRIRFMVYENVLFAWDCDRELWVIYSLNLTNEVRFNNLGRK